MPYRTLAIVVEKPRPTARCCGVCHPAVGGCLAGLYFTRGYGPWKQKIRPGITDANPEGTPPHLFINGKWEKEER